MAFPLLPELDVRSPDVLLWVPGVLLVTSTETEQLPDEATEPSLNVITLPPSGANSVPSQVDVALAGVAIVTPAGRLSENARSWTGIESLFEMLNHSVLTLLGPIVSGSKTLEKPGGGFPALAAEIAASTTARMAVANLPDESAFMLRPSSRHEWQMGGGCAPVPRVPRRTSV
jgi:hypothetical protein